MSLNVQIESPKTQSIDAVKTLLAFVGRASSPLPTDVTLWMPSWLPCDHGFHVRRMIMSSAMKNIQECEGCGKSCGYCEVRPK